MRQVYVDGGALVALLRPYDRAHRRMLAHFRQMLEQRDTLVTTDIAIAETATQLRREPGIHRVIAFQDALTRSVRGGGIRILGCDDVLRQRAFAVMAAHPDVPLTYGDCVAAALAGNKRVSAIVGVSRALRQIGYTVEPE